MSYEQRDERLMTTADVREVAELREELERLRAELSFVRQERDAFWKALSQMARAAAERT
jgi:hypothetical protein